MLISLFWINRYFRMKGRLEKKKRVEAESPIWRQMQCFRLEIMIARIRATERGRRDSRERRWRIESKGLSE